MKLERLRIVPAVRLVGGIPGELHEPLTRIHRRLRDIHGEVIEMWTLLVLMLRTFVNDDGAFPPWQRGTKEASAEAQA